MQKNRTRRTLKEQTIKDSFMFEAVMSDGDNCKELLEMILGKKLTHVKVSKEREMRSHPEYHGIRLDIFATDEYGTRYNIEMQVVIEFTPLRGRYYHSQMDMDVLLTGTKYKELPESYVIFICDYDPLGYNKYIYEMDTKCRQVPAFDYPDGVHTIFLSTKGTNDDETPDEIVKFLKYVSANLSESTQDFGSDFVSRLQQSVERIKHDRSKEREFMVLDDLLEIEHCEGIAEGRNLGLAEGREEGLAEGRELQAFNTTKYLYSIGLNNDQIAAAVGFSVADVEKWLASDKR